MAVDVAKLKEMKPPLGMPFRMQKLGHVVLNVTDIERSLKFYTEVLGFRVSDIYPETMVPGGMAFLRCNADHHCLALVGSAKSASQRTEMHHAAFEVASLDEVLRAREHLKSLGVPIVVDGRRRAGCQVAVEFLDPDGHHLEIYWGVDQVGTDGHVRPASEWREHKSIESAIDDPPPGQDTTLADPSLRKRA